MTHGSLFSGIGGFELAAEWAGWTNVFHCEWNEFGKQVLKYYWPESESFHDIKTSDFKKYEGRIDIITGGFPCQPFSAAGKRKGADDDRYLWPEMLRVIDEVKPRWVVGENVAGLISMVQPADEVTVECGGTLFGEDYEETVSANEYVIETVCKDLERIGYTVQPVVIPACATGAPHRRDRIWFIAYSTGNGYDAEPAKKNNSRRKDNKQPGEERVSTVEGFGDARVTPDTRNLRLQGGEFNGSIRSTGETETKVRQFSRSIPPTWSEFPTQPPVYSRNDGFSPELAGITVSKHRIESIKAYGNAIVPQVAYEIFKAINTIEP